MQRDCERVVLTEPIAVHGLVVGDVGTVVHIYPDRQAYEVEEESVNQCLMLHASCCPPPSMHLASGMT